MGSRKTETGTQRASWELTATCLKRPWGDGARNARTCKNRDKQRVTRAATWAARVTQNIPDRAAESTARAPLGRACNSVPYGVPNVPNINPLNSLPDSEY